MKRLLLLPLLLVLHFSVFAQQKDSLYNAAMKLPGVQMITVLGKYKVWTQKIGNGKIKVLLLHGGPGNTHEYLQSLADSLAMHGIEVYLYDQLGSYYSDQPKIVKGDTIWRTSMRVQEVEDLRKGLGLDHFYLYGHSYGAGLGLAYVHKYPQHVKGFIYSSMNANFTTFQFRYGKWVDDKTDSLLRMDTAGRKFMVQKDKGMPYDTIGYQKLSGVYFRKTFLARTNTLPPVLNTMRPHNNWDVANEIQANFFNSPEYRVNLTDIKVPVLLIAGDYDFTVSQKDLENMHAKLANSRVYIVKNSGHMSMLDEPGDYDKQILDFLFQVDKHMFKP